MDKKMFKLLLKSIKEAGKINKKLKKKKKNAHNKIK